MPRFCRPRRWVLRDATSLGACLRRSLSQTVVRSQSAVSVPPSSWAARPSPSSLTKTATRITGSRPPSPTRLGSRGIRSRPTWTSARSFASRRNPGPTRSTPGTASCPRIQTSPPPAPPTGSPSSAPPPTCWSWPATRSGPLSRHARPESRPSSRHHRRPTLPS